MKVKKEIDRGREVEEVQRWMWREMKVERERGGEVERGRVTERGGGNFTEGPDFCAVSAETLLE